MEKRQISAAVIGLMLGATLATPTQAEDATKTGLLAGLGVAAATGKTSLEGGAGEIEAGLLSADAFEQAAAIIKSVIPNDEARTSIVVLTADQQIDLVAPRSLKQRLDDAAVYIANQCKLAKKPVPKADNAKPLVDIKPGIADAVGVYSTETAIGSIALEADNQRLVDALLMQNADARANGGWIPWSVSKPKSVTIASSTPAGHSRFIIVSEPIDIPATAITPVAAAFNTFSNALRTERRDCPGVLGQKAIDFGDSFKTSLLDTSKGLSPLATAVQIEAAGNRPMILRVAIEQIGGTAIARSGVLYTFGWPNAATVSAGLHVSFRLTDPTNQKSLTVGEIRCLTPQANIKKVRDQLLHVGQAYERHRDGIACDYRATKVA